MERLVTHLHDFARETRLSMKEWMAALDFLVQVGQISSDVRHVSLIPYIRQQIPLSYPYPLLDLSSKTQVWKQFGNLLI